MFNAKDSLYNLRHARKRASSDTGCSESKILPIDQLRKQVAAKKRQRTDNASPFTSSTPATTFPAICGPAKKSVHFELTRNTYEEVSESSEEERQLRWLSPAESEQIKCKLRFQIATLQQGMILDEEDHSIRGLEALIDPVMTNERIAKGRNLKQRILQQQRLLKAMMGKVNERILGKLSSMLSVEDSQRAVQLASRDAHEAMLIHGRRSSSSICATPSTCSSSKSTSSTRSTKSDGYVISALRKSKLSLLQEKVVAAHATQTNVSSLVVSNPQSALEFASVITAGRTC